MASQALQTEYLPFLTADDYMRMQRDEGWTQPPVVTTIGGVALQNWHHLHRHIGTYGDWVPEHDVVNRRRQQVASVLGGAIGLGKLAQDFGAAHTIPQQRGGRVHTFVHAGQIDELNQTPASERLWVAFPEPEAPRDVYAVAPLARFVIQQTEFAERAVPILAAQDGEAQLPRGVHQAWLYTEA